MEVLFTEYVTEACPPPHYSWERMPATLTATLDAGARHQSYYDVIA